MSSVGRSILSTPSGYQRVPHAANRNPLMQTPEARRSSRLASGTPDATTTYARTPGSDHYATPGQLMFSPDNRNTGPRATSRLPSTPSGLPAPRPSPTVTTEEIERIVVQKLASMLTEKIDPLAAQIAVLEDGLADLTSQMKQAKLDIAQKTDQKLALMLTEKIDPIAAQIAVLEDGLADLTSQMKQAKLDLAPEEKLKEVQKMNGQNSAVDVDVPSSPSREIDSLSISGISAVTDSSKPSKSVNSSGQRSAIAEATLVQDWINAETVYPCDLSTNLGMAGSNKRVDVKAMLEQIENGSTGAHLKMAAIEEEKMPNMELNKNDKITVPINDDRGVRVAEYCVGAVLKLIFSIVFGKDYAPSTGTDMLNALRLKIKEKVAEWGRLKITPSAFARGADLDLFPPTNLNERIWLREYAFVFVAQKVDSSCIRPPPVPESA
jgi:hypothetical protein